MRCKSVQPAIGRLRWVALIISLLAPPMMAQQPAAGEAELIRQELQHLRQEYDQRIHDLEQRLHRLETPAAVVPVQSAPTTTPVPSSQTAAGQRPSLREAGYPANTESRAYAVRYADRAVAERVEEVLQEFVDIHGYFRAGYGRNDQGGPLSAFQAPGALSKYRLGNEAENYGELSFGKNFYIPGSFKHDAAPSDTNALTGPLARVQATMSIYNPHQDLLSSSSTDFGLPEAWGSIGNVFGAQPDVTFWAGSRYYRRHDIHISDFFFYNMSGTGGGIEHLQLPFGKVALAWIGAASSSGFSDIPEPDPENKAGFSKSNFDLRLYDVPMPLGKGEIGLVFARADSGRDAAGNSAADTSGFSATFLHTREGLFSPDGVNKFSLQYGRGPAKTFTSGFETFATQDGIFIRPDTADSWRFRVTEHFTATLSDLFSISPAFVYQFTDYEEEGGQVHWASAGVRPILHFSRFFSLASEAGVDWVRDDFANTEGPLYKFTLAPQVSLGRRFMSRPVIRAFATYALWDDDFSGQVGGIDYVDQTHGFTYGIQMEAWW